jgi:DNA-binding transcriptional LysR family regulator
MPTWLIGGDLAQGRLRPVMTDWQANVARQTSAARYEGGVYAMYLPNRRASAKVHVFTEFLVKKFGSPPYWDRASP